MSGFKRLEQLLCETQERLKVVKNALRKAPRGSLLIQRNGAYYTFLRVTTNDGKRIRSGVGSNKELVYRLAQKAYLKEEEKRLGDRKPTSEQRYCVAFVISCHVLNY